MSRTPLEEAQDPATSVERLKALAMELDLEISRAVGVNPNTPFATLEILWRKHPETYWQNPVVTLFQLEDPAFLSRLSTETYEALIQRPEADEAMLQAASRYKTLGIMQHVARHPNATPALLDEIAVDLLYQEPLLSIAGDPKALPQTIELLVGGPGPEVQRLALSHPSLAPDLVQLRPLLTEIIQTQGLPPSMRLEERYVIARCGPMIREVLAKDDGTPPALLVALLLGGEDPMSQGLASDEERGSLCKIKKNRSHTGSGLEQILAARPTTPAPLLHWLHQHSIFTVRGCLAENPSLPIELFEKLLLSCDEALTLAMLRNPKLPIKVLQQILTDHNPRVISQAIKHPNASREMFAPIFQPKRWRLRMVLAQDPKTPSHFIDELIEDEREEVSDLAKEHANASKANTARWKALKEEGLLRPDEIEHFMAGKGHLRRLLWHHPQRPPELIESFIHSEDTTERLFLARETRDPLVLERLARDKDFSVASAALKNPEATPALLRSMFDPKVYWHWLSLAQHEKTPTDVLEEFYQKNDPNVMIRLAQNPNTPRPILLEFARSKDHGLLSVLGRNPHAPPEIYHRLPRIKHGYIQQNIALQSIHMSAQVGAVSARVIRALAEVKGQDEAFLMWALGCPDPVLAEQIAASPNTPTKILEALAQRLSTYEPETRRETLSRMIQKHPNAPNSI